MHSDKVSTTASESRKSTKPIMEKRRRARINASLAELKSLLLEVIKKEGARHSKMEKADILEMTVKHLRQIQHQQFSVAASHDPSVINKYRLGFNECATEVSRYLASLDGCDVELRARLLNHLANCMTGVSPTSTEQPSATIGSNQVQADSSPISIRSPPEVASTSSMSSPPLQIATKMELQTTDSSDASSFSSGSIPSTSPDRPKLLSGVHVIPTKMSTGEIAFVLPTSCFPLTSSHVSNYVIPIYASSTQPSSTPSATDSIAFPALNFSANQVCPMPTLQPPMNYLSCPILPISSCVSNATSSPDTVAPDSSTNSLPSTPSTSGSRTRDSPAMEHQPDVPEAAEPADTDDMWRPWNCSE